MNTYLVLKDKLINIEQSETDVEVMILFTNFIFNSEAENNTFLGLVMRIADVNNPALYKMPFVIALVEAYWPKYQLALAIIIILPYLVYMSIMTMLFSYSSASKKIGVNVIGGLWLLIPAYVFILYFSIIEFL